MRKVGRLAAEVLEMIEPHVVPGISTGELDRICHEYIVNVQKAVPSHVRGSPPSGRGGGRRRKRDARWRRPIQRGAQGQRHGLVAERNAKR